MDEIIVRVARAIASQPRLRILSLLARETEITPTRLAAELRLPLNVLSLHLRTLSTAGLVGRRKSGAWCHYRAESPYDKTTLSGKLAEWLRSLLESPERSIKHLGLPAPNFGFTGVSLRRRPRSPTCGGCKFCATLRTSLRQRPHKLWRP
jgi:DNA-binding transcriptional ArsR family regulator